MAIYQSEEIADVRNLLGLRDDAVTEDVFAAKGWRGRGIARAMTAASLHSLSIRGYTYASPTVETRNTRALNVCLSLGSQVPSCIATVARPL